MSARHPPDSPLRNPQSALRNLNRSLAQGMIAKHQRAHRFYDRHCSGSDALLMSSARRQLSLLARTGHRFLFVADCSSWLKRDAKVNLLAITDAALHAPRIVSCRANSPTPHLKWIVVLRAPHSRRRKTGTDLESFCCRYAQHRFSKICIELVENRFTESGRNAANDAFNNTSHRIALAANLLDKRDHIFRRRGVGAANNILLRVFSLHRGPIDFRNDFVNLCDVSDDCEFRI